MPADKMTKPKKPPEYELRRRSKNYVGLYLGEHCLCAICTNTVRGAYDAELIVLALNQYAEKTEQESTL